MKRKIFILSTAALVAISGLNICYAVDKVTTDDIKLPDKEAAKLPPVSPIADKPFVNDDIQGHTPDGVQPPPPPFGHIQGPPPALDKEGLPPPLFEGKQPSKAEMEAKKIEFEKRLKLTDKQKKQIELQKQQDREKIKPIIDQIHVKKQEFRTIKEDTTLSPSDKDKKLKEVKDDLRNLKIQADSLRKENMQNFENVLTEKQKKEFSKIKEEQRKNMEQRRKAFKERHKNKQFAPGEKPPVDKK